MVLGVSYSRVLYTLMISRSSGTRLLFLLHSRPCTLYHVDSRSHYDLTRNKIFAMNINECCRGIGVIFRDRSQLSTFMKEYITRLSPENQHLFLITDNVL